MAKVQVTIDVEADETLGEALARVADREVSPQSLAGIIESLILKDATGDPWHALAKTFGDTIQDINRRAGQAFVPTRVTFVFYRDQEPRYHIEQLDAGPAVSPGIAARG